MDRRISASEIPESFLAAIRFVRLSSDSSPREVDDTELPHKLVTISAKSLSKQGGNSIDLQQLGTYRLSEYIEMIGRLEGDGEDGEGVEVVEELRHDVDLKNPEDFHSRIRYWHHWKRLRVAFYIDSERWLSSYDFSARRKKRHIYLPPLSYTKTFPVIERMMCFTNGDVELFGKYEFAMNTFRVSRSTWDGGSETLHPLVKYNIPSIQAFAPSKGEFDI